MGSSKRNNIGTCVDKNFLLPKRLLHFSHFETSLRISKTKWNSIFWQNFNFKLHDENCLSLWCGLCRKRCVGEQRTWASTTFREDVWCITPKNAGDRSSYGKIRKNLSKEKTMKLWKVKSIVKTKDKLRLISF